MKIEPEFKTVEECKQDARLELATESTEELRKIVVNPAYHYWFRNVAKELLQKKEDA